MSAVDTSAEAVRERASFMKMLGYAATSAFIEALAAERDALRHSLDAAGILAAALRDERDRLAAEKAKLRAALETAKAAITDRDGLNEFAISDTIWADKTETLLDHIDAALTGDTP